MRLVIVVVGLAGMVATARADERTTTVTLGASLGGYSDPNSYDSAKAVGGGTLALAWEHAPPAMPLVPGYNTDGSIVPELFVGLLADDQRGEMLLGAGVRAELRIAQKEQGLFKVSAKCALYAAARGMVIGNQQDAAGELAAGDYIYVSHAARLGVDLGVLVRRNHDTFAAPDQMYVSAVTPIFVASAFVGWAL